MLNQQDERRRRFVDDLAGFFAGYGLTPTLGRILAYLMLREDPASLDEIAADLGISKSGVSAAAKMLERWGMARRTTRAGSRRVLVEALASSEALLATGLPQLRRFRTTLHEGVDVAPPGPPRQRIQAFADTIDLYLGVVEEAIARIREERRS